MKAEKSVKKENKSDRVKLKKHEFTMAFAIKFEPSPNEGESIKGQCAGPYRINVQLDGRKWKQILEPVPIVWTRSSSGCWGKRGYCGYAFATLFGGVPAAGG